MLVAMSFAFVFDYIFNITYLKYYRLVELRERLQKLNEMSRRSESRLMGNEKRSIGTGMYTLLIVPNTYIIVR